MKLKVNFIYPAERGRLAFIYAGWLVLTGLICISVFMVFDGLYMKSHRQDIIKELDEKQKESSALRKPGFMPGSGDIAALKLKAAEINSLKINKSAGLTRILSGLEKLAPENVFFTRIEYSLDDGSVQFQASAPSAQVIPAFLERMENDGLYSAVTLEKQSLREPESGASKVLFTVKAGESN
jgi:hypothetical protein